MENTTNIGATPEELASNPELLLDLALSLVPRRAGLTSGLLAMLGGHSREKVRALVGRVHDATRRMGGLQVATFEDRFRAARDLLRAVANLEDAIFGLVVARLKVGTRLVPSVGM